MAYFYRLSTPKVFYHFAKRVSPWLAGLCLILFVYGLFGGLYLAPPDYQQGDAFRIMYIHVPAAIMSLAVFTFMAIWAVMSLVWKIKLCDVLLVVSAPLGAWFTFIALVTGSIWGKPMWGTYWIWDARLTSELILLFIYFGVIGLYNLLPEGRSRRVSVAIFTLIGFIDIPIVHFSVDWWHTLHQGASLHLLSKPTIVMSMLYPLLVMIGAFFCLYFYLLLKRSQFLVLLHDKKRKWIQEIV